MSKNQFTGDVIATLCFLVQDGQVLLARKTKKLVIGKWNGYGGRQEPGETIRQATARELFEETAEGVVVKESDLDKVALVHFHNKNEDESLFTVIVHVYLAKRWTGEARETGEMKTPTWFSVDNLPFDEMPPADKHWLPLVLAGNRLTAHFHYSPEQSTLIREPDILFADSLPEPD